MAQNVKCQNASGLLGLGGGTGVPCGLEEGTGGWGVIKLSAPNKIYKQSNKLDRKEFLTRRSLHCDWPVVGKIGRGPLPNRRQDRRLKPVSVLLVTRVLREEC